MEKKLNRINFKPIDGVILKYEINRYVIMVNTEKLEYVIHNTNSGRKYRQKRVHKNLRFLLAELRQRLENIGIFKKEKRLNLTIRKPIGE